MDGGALRSPSIKRSFDAFSSPFFKLSLCTFSHWSVIAWVKIFSLILSSQRLFLRLYYYRPRGKNCWVNLIKASLSRVDFTSNRQGSCLLLWLAVLSAWGSIGAALEGLLNQLVSEASVCSPTVVHLSYLLLPSPVVPILFKKLIVRAASGFTLVGSRFLRTLVYLHC